MEEYHAVGMRDALPPPADASTGRGAEDGSPAQPAIDNIRERERALTRLLHVNEAGDELFRAAVSAVAVAFSPRLAGIAWLHDHGTDLRIENTWFDGIFVGSYTWNIAPGLLRDIAGTGTSLFQRELLLAQLPCGELLDSVNAALFSCELLTCNREIVGILFWISDTGNAVSADEIGHLVAMRVSAELNRDDDRRVLRHREQRYNDVATMACDWFWEMNAEFRFTHLSERWIEITGLEASAYLGKTPEELGANITTGRWADFYAALRARRPARDLGTRTVAADGTVRYWRVNGKPYYDERGELAGFRGTGTDVTAEVLQRRRAEKAERLLHAAIEAIPPGFTLFDENDTLVVSNKAYKDLYPEIAEDLVPGADFVELVRLWSERTGDHSDDVSAEQLFQRRIRAHRAQSRKLEHIRADGKACLIDEQKTDDGCTVWLHTDVTTLKDRETELQALSAALADTNHQMDITINAMTDGLVMYDANDRLVLWNQHFQKIFGFGPNDLTEGMLCSSVVGHNSMSHLLANQKDDVWEKHAELRQRGEVTYKRRLDDGRTLEVKGVGMADGGVVKTFHDITLAEKQAQALRESAERLEAMNSMLSTQNAYFDATLNSMIQGLATFNSDDLLIVCNRQFQEMFQLPENLVVEGTAVAAIAEHIDQSGIWADAKARITQTHAQARQTGFEIRSMRFDDGRSYDVQNNLLSNGDLLVTFHEITELKQHARMLKDYADKLEFSNRELQEFAYVASHDLQEPLRKIEAFSDRLNKRYGDALDEDGRAYLQRMQTASARMRTLIADLLDYSRITTKAKSFGAVDLMEIMDDVVSDLEIIIESSAAEVRYSGLPMINGDATQMRQMLQNLVSNAVKFKKPDAAPCVEIVARRLSDNGEGSGGGPQIEICVRDNGIGFENKYADQVFKIFHRLHGRSDYEGTGIGLATCRKIVDRHGGDITASSEPGVGTTVTILIPAPEETENA